MDMYKYAIAGLQILKSLLNIKILKNRIPLYCEWDVTSHCNMNCEFCSTAMDNRNATKDISKKEALNIIEQLSEIGTRIIHFSGGEPTLRNDLPELIAAANAKNMITFITTNGLAPVERLAEIANADLIHISIDGTGAFHDSIRKTPGAFKKAIGAVKFLKDKKANVQIATLYTPSTSYEILENLCNVAKGLKTQISMSVLAKKRMTPAIDENKTIYQEPSLIEKYINILKRLNIQYGNVVTSPEPFLTMFKKGGLHAFGCRAMDITIAIRYDGSVSLPCVGLSIKLLKGNLRKIYYSKEALKLRSIQGMHTACKGCHVKCMCMASTLLNIRGIAAITHSYLANIFKKIMK